MAPSTSSPARKPHALAIPLPAQGHLNPLMRLCKVLASNGFSITFANVDPIHHRILECLEEHTAAQHALQPVDTHAPRLDIRRAHVPIQGLDMGNDFRVSLEHFFVATESLTGALAQLVEQLSMEGNPVTCLISDVFISGAAQKVADQFNIPRIVLFPSSQSFNLFSFYLLKGQIPIQKALDISQNRARLEDLFHDAVPGLPALRNRDIPNFKHVVDDNEYMYPFIVRQCEISYEKAHSILVNSFEELEGPAFTALSEHLDVPVYGVGPLVEELEGESSTSLWKEEDGCLDWLEGQTPQSVLFVSFGSVTILSKLQFEEVCSGLEASNQRFLWAFRPDLVDGAAYTSIPEDFLARTKNRGYVVRWAPQLRVLSHPSVGGFLTHCGWNSTVEGVASGVPMLVWPYFADQCLDAKYIVEEWKVGLRFEAGAGGVVGRGEVERIVRAVMEGEEGKQLRRRAAELKDAGRKSVEVGGSSYKNIQALVQAFSFTA